ncbi:serine/threonine protein kinase [Gorillibacterium sp. sgz5001074]|uniref:serine/threonine protein kinase n=1 Tax=Gorillibacterium sp. sgz5001074 TaxID=3446695 RepID=UPI003F67A2AD
MNKLLNLVKEGLLPRLTLESPDPHDPVEVLEVPSPWQLLGVGNYAAVLVHPDYADYAVKVYAPGKPGLQDELQVYGRLGRHRAFSECYGSGESFLILKRLQGVTLYDCIRRGIPIPERVIRDIDEALEYARSKGLYPHDIHAKNVMLADGRGLVLDVSDFLKMEYCRMWDDFKKAYRKLYKPLLLRRPVPIPERLLEGVRKSYRYYKKWRGED